MAIPVVVIVEGIKVLFQGIIALAKVAGMTEENTKEIFDDSWEKLKNQDPADLSDL